MQSVLKYCFGLPEVAFADGANLITEGKGRGPLYILVDGTVSVTREGIEVARVNTPGAIFGEISSLLDVPHTATVTAIGDVRTHMIEQANQFLVSRPQIAHEVAKLLAHRLHDATTYLVDAKRRIGDQGGRVDDIDSAIDTIILGTGEEDD